MENRAGHTMCDKSGLAWLTSLMRIIGGSAGGTLLKVPKGYDVRPTPDLVRQAIFNSLGARVLGTRVLELFAGTGALSLECLSRGAIHADCIEKSERHARILRENLQRAGLPAHTLQVRVQDAFTAIQQLAATGSRFDLVLADPPFGEKNTGRRSTSFAQRLLDDTQLPSLLPAEGLLILGHTRRDIIEVPDPWQETRLLRHGDSLVRFLHLTRGPAS
jgi:16S rRNA (guanine966-N2)-methyltransferase